MARDTLALLGRVRDRAVRDASAALSLANHGVAQQEQLVQAHAAQIARERETATGADAIVFAAWLPHARAQAAVLQAALDAAQQHAERCRETLVGRRTEAEIVVKLKERRKAEADLVARRREQALLDEMASRPRDEAFRPG